MEKTAINSIYLLCHIIEDTQEQLELAIESDKTGFVWKAYFRKDEAKREADQLNEMFSKNYKMNKTKYYHKYIVVEKPII